MFNVWDEIAEKRHLQLTKQRDLTFWNILVSEIQRILCSDPKYHSFSVLDVGCGTGVLSKYLSSFVGFVVGIEPSVNSSQIAQKYTKNTKNVVIENETIESFSRKKQDEFDFAIANMVLHTIEDPQNALLSINMTLKKNGHLLISIPHPCFWALIKENDFTQSSYLYPFETYHNIEFSVSSDPEIISKKTPYFHRPLSFYFSAIRQANFKIIKISEPFPNKDLMKMYRRKWKYPGFIFFLCKKEKGGFGEEMDY